VCANFLELSKKKIHLNRSSERKVMPVLRRTLRNELGLVAVETESDANRWMEKFLKIDFFRWQQMEKNKTELKQI
jgi:hypothetical protein